MKPIHRILIVFFIIFDAVLIIKILTAGKIVALLQPRGWIAMQDKELFLLALGLMLLVVIPVFILAIYVGFTFHEKNGKAKYTPDWDHNTKLQIFLWAFPSMIIAMLCVIVWVSAHKLDPHVSLASTKKPVIVQVIGLRWKWLFIYPEQHIATVNYLVFPEKTPVNFQLTAYESPMTSFWIPQIGGQIYAMSGMATQTHLIADSTGVYRGSNAEINGPGFAGMTFTAKSVSQHDFDAWVNEVKQKPNALTQKSFQKLAVPTEDYPVSYFSSTEDSLYTTIVMHYMAHPSISMQQPHTENSMQGMEGM